LNVFANPDVFQGEAISLSVRETAAPKSIGSQRHYWYKFYFLSLSGAFYLFIYFATS